jgi:hypothetical protein
MTTICYALGGSGFVSAPPKDYLPEDGRGGILVSKNGVPICAGFIS